MLDPPEPQHPGGRPSRTSSTTARRLRPRPLSTASPSATACASQGIGGLCQLDSKVGKITNANYRGMDPAARFAVVLEEGPARLAVAEGRQLRKQVATALLVPLPQQAPAAAVACSRRRSERGYLYRGPFSLSDTEPCSGATGS